MNAVISETIRAAILGLGMQILEIPAQRRFASSVCHAYSNPHKLPKPVAPTIEMCLSRQYLSIDPKGVCHAHSSTYEFVVKFAGNLQISIRKFR